MQPTKTFIVGVKLPTYLCKAKKPRLVDSGCISSFELAYADGD
jgi:hypothetical protein